MSIPEVDASQQPNEERVRRVMNTLLALTVELRIAHLNEPSYNASCEAAIHSVDEAFQTTRNLYNEITARYE